MPEALKQNAGQRALARWDNEGGAREHSIRSLPKPVVDLAARLGVQEASGAKMVTLTQSGDMRLGKGTRRTRFQARQTIELTKTGFAWRATAGPFGAISVCDAYQDGAGVLDVRLFGRLRLAHMDGPELAKGEVMRYLAELAWAPDAIISNKSLDWSEINGQTMYVAAGSGAGRGSVRIDFDENGRIGSVFAPDRPFTDGRLTSERPWSGRFFDYRCHHGRWLPFAAEVGWAVDGWIKNYWRGAITSWTAT